jgi:hypothetical protein
MTVEKSMQESEKIKTELKKLRQTGHILKTRPLFMEHAKATLSNLPHEDVELLHDSLLIPDLRSSIISRLVNSHSSEWLQTIKRVFFVSSEAESAEQQEQMAHIDENNNNDYDEQLWRKYEASFSEKAYSKNVVGAMKESAFLSSHGGGSGLTARVLGDVLWSIWNTLFSSIRACLERELTEMECNILVQQVLHIEGPFIQLWLETIKNSRNGVSRQGVLPAKWRAESEKEKQRLNAIKMRGADARWGQTVAPVSSINTPQDQKEPDFKRLRTLLEENLQFRFNEV